MIRVKDLISDFQRHALEIDCFHISLVQNASEIPISFKGRGYIRQTADDKLTCKIFVEETANTDQWKWMMLQVSGKSGQLYSDNDYFGLVAKDANGTVWTAEGVMPVCNWRSEEANPIITADLTMLATEVAAADPEHLACLHFLENAELPLMPDSVELSRDKYKFDIRKLEGAFSIEVSSDSALPEGFAGRVQEALRFVLAQPVQWRALRVSDGNRQKFHLASAEPRSHNIRLDPPIGRRKSPGSFQDFWRMFSLYLEYIVRNSRHDYWNYCSYHARRAQIRLMHGHTACPLQSKPSRSCFQVRKTMEQIRCSMTWRVKLLTLSVRTNVIARWSSG